MFFWILESYKHYYLLTPCGLWKPYHDIYLGQNWLVEWTISYLILTYHDWGFVAFIWHHCHKKIWWYPSIKEEWEVSFNRINDGQFVDGTDLRMKKNTTKIKQNRKKHYLYRQIPLPPFVIHRKYKHNTHISYKNNPFRKSIEIAYVG